MMPYPVVFDVTPPARFDRVQLVLRLLILMVLGLIGVSFGWIVLLLYLALPAAAALVIESRGAEEYLTRTAPGIERVLRWLLSITAYMSFLSDRFPTGEASMVRFEVSPTGVPSRNSALMRLLTSFPEAVILAVLALVAGMVAFVSFLFVLFTATVPDGLVVFQRAFLRWEARLFAYHASLVDVPPPYALDGRPERAVET
jgi:hypothetical protein